MLETTQALREWLSQALNTDQAISLTALKNDASFRRYYRVQQGTNSRVVMDAPPAREDSKPYIQIAQRLLAAGLHVPEILAADLSQGFLLLSDLGDTLYLSALQQADKPQLDRLYGDALSALAVMQTCVPAADLPPYSHALLCAEMALFKDWLLVKHLNLQLDTADQQQLENCVAQLAATALAQSPVFVHRDYHARNLLVAAHNPGILDFQDAVYGPATYDLVSLLRDAYIVWPQAWVEDWALGYQQLALQSGIAVAADESIFLRDFDWMGLQRHLKVAGIFARLYHRDGKAGYLADIPLVLRYLSETAKRYPEMHWLQALIEERVLPAYLTTLTPAQKRA